MIIQRGVKQVTHPDSVVQGTLTLYKAVHEIHKLRYQNLRCLSYQRGISTSYLYSKRSASPNGFCVDLGWTIANAGDVTLHGETFADYPNDLFRKQNGESLGVDFSSYSPKQIADLILDFFNLESIQGEDWGYSGWFSNLLGFLDLGWVPDSGYPTSETRNNLCQLQCNHVENRGWVDCGCGESCKVLGQCGYLPLTISSYETYGFDIEVGIKTLSSSGFMTENEIKNLPPSPTSHGAGGHNIKFPLPPIK